MSSHKKNLCRRSVPRGGFALCIWGLILASLLLLPAESRLLTGQAAQTEWLTFTEESFGYRIDYPADWVPRLVADNTANGYGQEVALRSVGFFGPNSQIVFVDVWENRSNLSLAEWMTRYPSPVMQDANPSASLRLCTELVEVTGLRQSQRLISVNGGPAMRFESLPPILLPNPQSPSHYRSQFLQGDLVVAIEYAALQPNLDIYQAMLDSYHPISPTQKRLAPSQLSGDNPPAAYGVQTQTCCTLTDYEYNPFPCNTAGDASCPYPPCGNCTWWVRYKRQGGATANLDRCTGDANTWLNCAQSYYPAYLSPYPEKESIVLYPGVNHVSFIENMSGNTAYSYSDLSWYDPCPAHYGNSSAGGGKQFIANPETYVPNVPPNRPELDSPAKDAWVNTHKVTLDWTDQGDPDDKPYDLTFLAEIQNDKGWSEHSGWLSKTSWSVTLPADGGYTWRVKSSDGMYETWSVRQDFYVDAAPPVVTFKIYPATGQWYNTNAAINWIVEDPDPGSGVDYFKWEWDDSTPDNTVNDDEGSTALNAAGQGQHTLYVRAWDEVGNASTTASLGWFGYDTVPPTLAFDAANPQPERWYNTPQTIAWSVNDPPPGSGVWHTGYIWMYNDVLEDINIYIIPGAVGEATHHPLQGRHLLRTYTKDNAGNYAPSESKGWFGYDSLIPAPPSITVTCAISNNWPQNACLTPTFSWQSSDPDAPDASGIAGYAFTWGYTAAISTNWTSANWSQTTIFTPTDLPADGSYTAFLHVAAKDGAGNIGSPATFALRYAPGGSATFPPTDAADDFYVVIDNNKLFTNKLTITVSANAPGVSRAALSVSPDDPARNWRPTPLTRTWILTPAGDNAAPHRIYARFQDDAGMEYGPYFDDIIYDSDYPRGRVLFTDPPGTPPSRAVARALSLSAWDDSSGVSDMRLGSMATVTQTTWQPYTATAIYTTTEAVIYAQFRDRAGNPSPIYGTDGSDSSVTSTYLPLIFR